ncbi:MAG TPA: aldolase/citrate lyase family protein [Acetobacteraceae bacterium]|nr:aldolase/citrate lyase family protein [Acetobacteraceae bacterium]
MSLKDKLADIKCLLNAHVCVIPSAVVTQAVAAAGADCVVIDQEHGPIGFETLHAMIAATQGTSCAPLVRIPEVNEAHVKRALDAGAEGICFPLIRTEADARRCVASLRYPPAGKRGWGPFVAHSRWGTPLSDYASGPGQETVCMILLETADAVENIDAICAVQGIDCVIVASFDLSTELGVSGQFDHPKMLAAVGRIEAAAAKSNIPLGGIAFTKDATEALIAKGYRLLCGFDVLWLKGAIAQSRSWLSGYQGRIAK